MSFSESVGDDPTAVRENLARAAHALDVPRGAVLFLSQVHGNGVVEVDGSSSAEKVVHLEGDALVSRAPSVACGVRSADCVPVLVGARSSGAVAAIHAGWRGTVRGVVESAVRRLCDISDAGGADLVAAIGPHISLAAFEVSEEVAAELRAASPDPDVIARTFGPRPHVDLRRIVRAKLRALGLADAAIDDVPGCTLSEPGRFFSFRRDGARSGRHLSAIVARG